MVKVKVTSLRSALNSALADLGIKMARGSMQYDAETGSVSFELDLPKAEAKSKPQTSDTGDADKDKFVNIVNRLELDTKVRRWYGRNLTDTNGDKWVISAISTKGDKFTLAPKDGEGRNKRVDFDMVSDTIAAGRGAKLEFPSSGSRKPATPSSSGGSTAKDKLHARIDKLSDADVKSLYNSCVDAELCKATRGKTRKALLASIMKSDKLTGRGSVTSFVTKLEKGQGSASSSKSSKAKLNAKQQKLVDSKCKKSYNADRKKFASSVNAKFARVPYLASFETDSGVRFIVGYNLEKSKVRTYDPESGRFLLVATSVVLRSLNK